MIDCRDETVEKVPTIREPLGWPIVVTVTAALAAAWLAAGSTGLVADPLRKALMWVLLGVAICAQQIPKQRTIRTLAAALLAIVTAVLMIATPVDAVNVFAAAVVLALMAVGRSPQERRAIAIGAAAIAVFGVYRVGIGAIPTIWTVTDRLGWALGALGGTITGKGLWTGATFSGLDYLVTMAALYVGCLATESHCKKSRGLWVAVAIVSGHLIYLMIVSWATDIHAAIPAAPTVEFKVGQNLPWYLTNGLRTLVPWNLPAVAGLIHLLIVAAILRWAPPSIPVPPGGPGAAATKNRSSWLWWPVAMLLAVALPCASYLSMGLDNLAGKKVVAYEEGFLNWNKAEHDDYGRLSIGMYGLLPTYVESLGGTFLRSAALSTEDLADADVLILLFANEQWVDGQLERIGEFVDRGGTLMIFGEHTIHEPDKAWKGPSSDETSRLARALDPCKPEFPSNRFNELLAITDMRVNFDSGMFEVGGWLQSYQALAHPASLGIADDRNQFGVVIGGSIKAGWPSRPLLAGQWGWNDAGDQAGSAMMGNRSYDGGEKLGDIVLAAEQPVGKGLVIAFADTSGMTNGITVGCHEYTSRLLAYAAARAGERKDPWPVWKQLGVILLAAILVKALFTGQNAGRVAITCIILGGSLATATRISYERGEVIPDLTMGGEAASSALAYIDSAHVETFSQESWRYDGTMGLILNLMRNDYLVLDLPRLTAPRLAGASLLISIAPSREFTGQEREIVKDWVHNGGVFICTVGYEDRFASVSLLAEFDLKVGLPLDPHGREVQPQPMGHFKTPYIETEHGRAHVRYHAAWPVWSDAPPDQREQARVITYGRGYLPEDLRDDLVGEQRKLAVIIKRHFGSGAVILVGDTHFAVNKNLEWESGQPFDGMYENAHFWRWLLTPLRHGSEWLPPAVRPPATQLADDQEGQP